MIWEYKKFKGDGAIYAFCPNCDFHHSPSVFDPKSYEVTIAYEYNYCPMCGEHLCDNKRTWLDVKCEGCYIEEYLEKIC